MFKGWLKLHRSLLDNDLWLAEPFTKGQAWVDLIGHANHRPGSVWIRGIEVQVKRGQLAWSELTMAKRWKWSRGKVRRYLGTLETRQMIVQETSPLTTLLTICKYEVYQGSDTTDDTPDGTTNDATGGTTDGQQTVHKQECKKNKNEKNTNTKSDTPDGDAEPAAFYLPTNKNNTTGETYPITQTQIDEWAQAFPACNVIGEIRQMKVWLDANKSKRKTRGGMGKFVANWLSRTQNNGGPKKGPQKPANPLSDKPSDSVMAELVRNMRHY